MAQRRDNAGVIAEYDWLIGDYGIIWPMLGVIGLIGIPWLLSWAMYMIGRH